MSKGNTTETDLLKVVFLNDYDPSWRENSYVYVALHTADPGEAGTQQTSEAAYTNYARVQVAKTSAGWTVSGNQVVNAAAIQFPQCGASGCIVTHVSIGLDDTEAGQILYSGALATPITIANNTTPQFVAGALVISED